MTVDALVYQLHYTVNALGFYWVSLRFSHALVFRVYEYGLVLCDEFDHFELVYDFIRKKQFYKFSVVSFHLRVFSLDLVFVKVESVSVL